VAAEAVAAAVKAANLMGLRRRQEKVAMLRANRAVFAEVASVCHALSSRPHGSIWMMGYGAPWRIE
jgi:hypothetical protein